MAWIHEHKDWPNFSWDSAALAVKLADVRHRQGCLLGRMEGLGFSLKREARLHTLTNDVVKSSGIEGENLNPEEVRSSIARKLGIGITGLVPAGRDVEGVVEMMLDATQHSVRTSYGRAPVRLACGPVSNGAQRVCTGSLSAHGGPTRRARMGLQRVHGKGWQKANLNIRHLAKIKFSTRIFPIRLLPPRSA